MSAEQGTRLTEETEVLFRQVHPQFYACGRISSQAFEAPRDHGGRLSVDRETLTTAMDAFDLYTEGFGRESACVCGVSVLEVNACELDAFADPVEEAEDHPANPAHAIVDLSDLSRSQMKKRAGKLGGKARDRGILYQP